MVPQEKTEDFVEGSMADIQQDFEVADNLGSTEIVDDLAGPTDLVYTNEGKRLSDFLLVSKNEGTIKNLKFRLSDTGDYFDLGPDRWIAPNVKETTELRVAADEADTRFQLLLNWEHY
jgi:hypothetical protein